MTTMIYIEAPGTRNYIHYRGDTFYDSFVFEDTAGSAVDLTGWSASLQGWPAGAPNGSTAVIALTSGTPAYVTLGGTAGSVTIKAAGTVADDWPVDTYDYQFKFTDAAGDIQTYLVGTIDQR
jgi:hypothetical protein